MVEPDDPIAHAYCKGCGRYGELLPVICLGCLTEFKRCVICFPMFTACSDSCKEAHRRRLAMIFAPDGPKIGGIGDIRI